MDGNNPRKKLLRRANSFPFRYFPPPSIAHQYSLPPVLCKNRYFFIKKITFSSFYPNRKDWVTDTTAPSQAVDVRQIEIKTFDVGTNDISNSATLPPGTYGNVTIPDGGSVTISGGTYNFKSLQIYSNAQLIVQSGPVVINIEENITMVHALVFVTIPYPSLFHTPTKVETWDLERIVSKLINPSLEETVVTSQRPEHYRSMVNK